VVKSLSGDSLTVTEGLRSVTYKTVTLTIPANATVMRNFNKATLSDLKTGDRVHVAQSSDGTTVFADDGTQRPRVAAGTTSAPAVRVAPIPIPAPAPAPAPGLAPAALRRWAAEPQPPRGSVRCPPPRTGGRPRANRASRPFRPGRSAVAQSSNALNPSASG